jgi:hypothetical protein
MRELRLLVTPPTSHPSYQLFDEASPIRRERIYNLNLLEDGTMVLLGRIRGDIDRARSLTEAAVDVLGFSITDEDDEGAVVFVHARPPPPVTRFLELPREHEVFFDFPIEGIHDGRLRVQIIGETNEVLQSALADVPSELDVIIERIGPHPKRSGAIAAALTDRQREVLDAALDLGYYEMPRQATHDDIAEEMGLTTPTVTEHLQKVEARVFGSLFE